jgi:dipeptidase E
VAVVRRRRQGVGSRRLLDLPASGYPDWPDNILASARRWATKIDGPAYAIDDQTAIKVVDGAVEIVSEGHWGEYP